MIITLKINLFHLLRYKKNKRFLVSVFKKRHLRSFKFLWVLTQIKCIDLSGRVNIVPSVNVRSRISHSILSSLRWDLKFVFRMHDNVRQDVVGRVLADARRFWHFALRSPNADTAVVRDWNEHVRIDRIPGHTVHRTTMTLEGCYRLFVSNMPYINLEN